MKMTQQLPLWVLILTTALISCRFHTTPFEPEEASVYNDYINKYYIPKAKAFVDERFVNMPFDRIVVGDLTSGYIVPINYKRAMEALSPKPDKQTVKDFLDRNEAYYAYEQITKEVLLKAGRHKMNPYIKFDLNHILFSDKQWDSIFLHEGKWDEFYRLYPNSRGIVFLSHVGFNARKTQALLYFTMEYDGGAGEGYLIMLERNRNGWIQKAQTQLWVS
jgi:hypothetical protein